jgi:hypothetical protein
MNNATAATVRIPDLNLFSKFHFIAISTNVNIRLDRL